MRQHSRFNFQNRPQERRVFFTEARFLRFAECREADNLPHLVLGKPDVSAAIPFTVPGSVTTKVREGVKGASA